MNGVHLGVRFPCEICSRTYTQKDSLNAHMKAMHAHDIAAEGLLRTMMRIPQDRIPPSLGNLPEDLHGNQPDSGHTP